MHAYMTRFLRSPYLAKTAIPKPLPHELLIKVSYVSLNPTDYKHASMSLPPSKIIGCDFSGLVTGLGSSISSASSLLSESGVSFKKGDRVAGIIHGCHYSHTGAFAEYLVADARMCYKVPGNVSLERACTLGVGWISALQALGQRLFLGVDTTHTKYPKEKSGKDGKKMEEKEEKEDDTLLIYSAATNMGMHTIQQVKNYYPSTKIIAIASKQHHDYLRQLGAHHVFDYRSRSLVQDIRSLGRDIRKGIDCHSEGISSSRAAECMIPTPPIDGIVDDDDDKERRLIRTLPPGLASGPIPKNVKIDDWILSYTALGKPFWFLFKYYPAVQSDYEESAKYLSDLTELLQEEKVVPVRHRLMTGGLAAISEGFEEMRGGRVRGEKLVYEVGGEA